MSLKKSIKKTASLVLTLLAIAPSTAHASLGGGADTIKQDQIQIHARREKLHKHKDHLTYTLRRPGLVIREYASSSTGQVFAIDWQGRFQPDLAQLLGTAYDEFTRFSKKQNSSGGRHSESTIETPNLKVVRKGHFGHLSGRAFLKADKPAQFMFESKVAVTPASPSEAATPPAPSASCPKTAFTATAFPVVLPPPISAATVPNTMSIAIDPDSNCSFGVNKPCVTVTICSPSDPNNCQTISDILLDTGSSGLRIFKSVITVPLTPVTNGNSALAECMTYGDGSSQWGPVESAYVKLGFEPEIAVPILVIDQTFGTPTSDCSAPQSNPNTTPDLAGFNGILGVGLAAQDCGTDCVTSADNSIYYSCTGTNCSCGAMTGMNAQVVNPITALTPINDGELADNNGVILDFPPVPPGAGLPTLTGTLTFGIDTRPNNSSAGTTLLTADPTSDEINAIEPAYSSQTISAYIDSGTNQLIFPNYATNPIPNCGSNDPDWAGYLCPTSPQTVNATLTGIAPSGGTASSLPISLLIGNAYKEIVASSNPDVDNEVFGDTASVETIDSLDDANIALGMPFFYGKRIFVGIQGLKSAKGTGPYWAL